MLNLSLTIQRNSGIIWKSVWQREVSLSRVLAFTLKSSQWSTSTWLCTVFLGLCDVPPLRFCPNWSDCGQKKSSPVNLKTDVTWYMRFIFHFALLFLLPLLCLERDSCFFPRCPPSVTLISPFNYSHYLPPNASLSPRESLPGKGEKWKGNAGADGRQGAHQWGYGETEAVVIWGLCQSISCTASSPPCLLGSWCRDKWAFPVPIQI